MSSPLFNAEVVSWILCLVRSLWLHSHKGVQKVHKETRFKLVFHNKTSAGFLICRIPLRPHPLRSSTWALSFYLGQMAPCFSFAADQRGILADCTLWHLCGWQRKLVRWRPDMPSGRHWGSLPWRPLLLSHLFVNVLCYWKRWCLLVSCKMVSFWQISNFLETKKSRAHLIV